MTDREQRELRNGAGDAFSASFELIANPVIFGFLGWYIDRKLDLFPVFTLVLALIALAYGVWKLYTNYVSSMDDLLDERRTRYRNDLANG